MSDSPIADPPPPLQPSLPGSAYLTAEAFARDSRAILARDWMCIAREEDLPERGDLLLIEIAGESVILLRGAEG